MERLFSAYCNELNKTHDEELCARRPDIYMDILLSLIIKIDEEGVKGPISPGSVILDDDNTVRFKEHPSEGLLYCAPEVIFDGADNNSAAQLFSLGMLIFYMIYSADYYSVLRKSVLDIEEIREKHPGNLIDFSGRTNGVFPESYFQRLREAMKDLTAWDPEKREVGKIKLIDMYSYIVSRNRIHFVEGNNTVAIGTVEIKEDLKGYPQSNNRFKSGNVSYEILEKIDIPYRPGIHDYYIKVRRAG